MLPTGQGVGAVADIGGSFRCPAFVGDDVLTDGVIGREGHELVPVGDFVGQGDDQGAVIGCFDVQLRIGVGSGAVVISGGDFVVAVDDFHHVAVVSAQRSGGSTVPSEHEIASRQGLAVGPFQAFAQGVGVGHGAVVVDNAFGQVFCHVSNDLQVAVFVLSPFADASKQVGAHGAAVNGGVERGVDGVRLGGEADGQGVGRGSRFAIGTGGALVIILAVASNKAKHHGNDQQQSDDLFHFVLPFGKIFSICRCNAPDTY